MDLDRALVVLALADTAAGAVLTPSQDAAAAELRAADGDVSQALRLLLREDPVAAVRMAGELSGFWQDAGRLDEGRELTADAVVTARRVAGPGTSSAGLAQALLVGADLAFRAGDQAETIRLAREAITEAERANDPRTAALAWLDLSRVAFRDEDPAGIEAAALRAQAAAPDDPLIQRGVLHMLAWAAHTGGDLALAKRRFEDSLAVRRRQGGRLGIASELSNLGDIALDAGDLDGARTALREAFEIALELDSAYLIVNTLPSLAGLAARSDPELGARLFGAADAAATRSGLTPDPGADRADLRDALRRELGSERFDTLLAQGAAMRLSDVVTSLGDRQPASPAHH